MAIVIYTQNPTLLLTSLKHEIDQGKIETWSYDSSNDFTHSPEQWSKKAWLRPQIGSGVLMFGLVGCKSITMTKVVYGVYHGRFIEMLLTHFDKSFSTASASAEVDPIDVI
jgi:hypothetical protein